MLGKEERFFYEQIAFLLKTFFFVYIGVLIPFHNMTVIIIGTIIAIGAFFARQILRIVLSGEEPIDRKLILAVFGRGLAPAAIAQIAVSQGAIPPSLASEVVGIIFIAILATILFSSISVFVFKHTTPVELDTAAK